MIQNEQVPCLYQVPVNNRFQEKYIVDHLNSSSFLGEDLPAYTSNSPTQSNINFKRSAFTHIISDKPLVYPAIWESKSSPHTANFIIHSFRKSSGNSSQQQTPSHTKFSQNKPGKKSLRIWVKNRYWKR